MELGPYHHERLSAVDALLLDLEDRCNLMHVGAVLIFEGGALRRSDGSLDVPRIRRHVEARLVDLPRYRQRLRRVALFQHPVWVDDAAFDIDAHVRAVSLVGAGGQADLSALVSDLMGEPLDRRAPLWALYVVDGLQDGRFAVVAKVHHCIVDGVLGMAVLASLLGAEPSSDEADPEPFAPRPPPPMVRLFEEELRARGQRTASLLHTGRRWLARPVEGRQRLKGWAKGLMSYAKSLLPVSVTPLNAKLIGPRRRFGWVWMDLQRLKALKTQARCTVNDVVLALVAGAVRSSLLKMGHDPSRLVFRVMVPVNRHGGTIQLSEGNRVSVMLAPLPIGEADPERRLACTAETMRELKATGQASALWALEGLAELSTSQLLAEATHQALTLRPFSMIVTNIPGPPIPLYLLEARLLEAYPLVPLVGTTGVGIAVLSYDGRVGFGVNMDPDAVARPEAFVRAVEEALVELEGALPLTGAARPEDAGTPVASPHPRRE